MRQKRQHRPQECEYLSPEETAERLGVPVDTLRRWRSVGKTPPQWIRHLNGTVAYPVSELEAYKAERLAEGNAEAADRQPGPGKGKPRSRRPDRTPVLTPAADE